jgi:hypothetical protein
MALALAAGSAHATTRTWPGAAPCDGTLQGCIASSGDGDIVEVASNSVIDESLSFGVPLTLRAAGGYGPQLALDRVISVNAAIDGDYAIEGFTLQRGFVSVTHTAGDASVRVRHVRVLAPMATGPAQI